MKRLMTKLHDMWCVITRQCPPRVVMDDPYIKWMQEQEQSALESAVEIRERRQHAMVATLRHQREQRGE